MLLSLPQDRFLAPGEPLRPVRIPGSKSVTNRALLLAALTPGTSHLQGGLEAEDTRWMRQALRGLGIPVVAEGGAWRIQGGTRPRAQGPISVSYTQSTLPTSDLV